MNIKDVVKKHEDWVSSEGVSGERAILTNVDMRGANLIGVNLSHAIMIKCNLSGADLRDSNLSFIDLSGSVCNKTNFKGANLSFSNLSNTKIRCSDLRDCILISANLERADLYGADMRHADIRSANLDFSVFQLWEGVFDVVADERLFAQLAYHMCRLITTDKEIMRYQKELIPIAQKYHMADEHRLT